MNERELIETLLAACERAKFVLLNYRVNLGPTLFPELDATIAQIDEAIAKAKGGE